MRINVCLWVLVVTSIVLSGCADIPANHAPASPGAMSDAQLRSWQYSQSVQSAQATSLLNHPTDLPPSDQSLITQSKANYIQRGYDPKKAEQCAKDDFISTTGRTPNPTF